MEIPEWQKEHAEQSRKWALEQETATNERLAYFRAELPNVARGLGRPAVLHDLAAAYFGVMVEAEGERPRDRLSHFLNGDEELVTASIEGFKHSLERANLPSVADIIDLATMESYQGATYP